MKPRILSTARLSFPLAAAIAALFSAQSLHAQLYYKSTTANSWTGSFWGTVPGGPYTGAWVSNSPVVFEDNGGTTSLITGATTQFASITANENVTVTASGTLGTNGTVATVTVATGKNLNFGTQAFSTAAGTGLIKDGDGILTLAGATYPGGFTLNAGTLAVGGVNAMGDGGALTINGGTIRSGGTTARDLSGKYDLGITIGGDFALGDTTANGALTFSNDVALGATNRIITANSAATFGGVFSGSSGIGFTKSGTGTIRLNGANTYSGATIVNNGLLQIGNYAGLSNTSSLTVSGGGTSNLQLVQVGTGTTSNSINKALSLHGTLSTAGGTSSNRLNLTWTGAITLAGDSIITPNGNSQINISSAGSVDLGAHALTYRADGSGCSINGNITGTGGSLIKTSPQDLTLGGTNSYTGTTTIAAGGGRLAFGNRNALYDADTSKWTAANINVQSTGVLGFFVGGINQFTTTDVTLLLTNLAASSSATNGMNAGSELGFDTSSATGGTFTIADVIADTTGANGGARGLRKLGTNTLVLTNANTYSGNTTIQNGTLRLQNAAALGTSPVVTLSSSATTLSIGTDTAITEPRIVSTAGTIVLDRATPGAGLTRVFSGVSRLGNGNTTITAGSNVTSGTATIQFASLDNDNGTVAGFGLNPTTANVIVVGGMNMGGGANAGTANFTLTGSSSGNSIGGAIVNGARVTANLIKSGSSTWTLGGDNTYNGTTTANGGTLVTTKAAALPGYNTAGLVRFSGGTIAAQVEVGLSGGWTTAELDVLLTNATKTSGALGIDTTNGNLTFASANLNSAIGLAKLGANTLTLNGSNTYAGNTTISGGTLQVGDAAALGFGGIQATAAGTTTVNSGFTLDLNGAATVNEPLILNGTGIGGNGALINNSGTAIIGNGVANLTLPLLGTGSAYSTAPAVTISGTGTGATATASLGVTAASFGAPTVTGTPTAATVAITGGGGSGATATITLAGVITITNPGTGYTSAPTITATVTGGTIAYGASNATNFTVSGLALTNAGSGYTGTPTYAFDAGNASGAAVIGTLSSVVLASDSSIGGSGNTTIHAVVSEAGGSWALTKVGAGTVTLNGLNTYTGETKVDAGTLSISTDDTLANAAAVRIDSSAFLNLGFSGTDTVDRLYIGGVEQASGTWGSLASSATNKTARITGSGILDVTNGGGPANNYAAWAASQTPPVTEGPAGDDDKDGVKNLVEYALADGQERGSLTGTTLSFAKRGLPFGTDVTYEIESSDNLGISDPWSTVAPTVDTASTISYTLPNPGDNFARLKVVQVP